MTGTLRARFLAGSALVAFLAFAALGLGQPGAPMTLRGEEAGWLVTAESLGNDLDLRLDPADRQRLFHDYPYATDQVLPLRRWPAGDSTASVDASSDAALSPRLAPGALLYPAVAAPVARGFGSNGLRLLGALLFAITVWATSHTLRSLWPPSDRDMAPVVATTALVLSPLAPAMTRLGPTSMVAALVALSAAAAVSVRHRSTGRDARAAAASGLALGLAAWHAPFVLVSAPAFGLYQRSLGRRVVFGGTLVAVVATIWLPRILVPPPAIERFALSSPFDEPWRAATKDPTIREQTALGQLEPVGALDRISHSARRFVDRRDGVFPYLPLALLWLPAFASRGSNRAARLALCGGLLVAAVLAPSTAAEPFTSTGTEGFGPVLGDATSFGNPLLAALWPAALLLLSRAPSTRVLIAGALGAALLLGPALATPYLPPVPDIAAHHHERGWPWRSLPLSPAHVGRSGQAVPLALGDGLRLWRSTGTTSLYGGEVFLLGGEPQELWLDAPQEQALDALHVQLRVFAPAVDVALRLGRETTERHFVDVPPEGAATRLELHPGSGTTARAPDGSKRTVYRLRATTSTGAWPAWRGAAPIQDYAGAALVVLGTGERLGRDVYGVDWSGCGAPAQVETGQRFRALATLANTSPVAWPIDGAARVRIGSRWRRTEGGAPAIESPRRADFTHSLDPGASTSLWVEVDAPPAPGTWELELEPVFETVDWFSKRAPDAICRTTVRVVG